MADRRDSGAAIGPAKAAREERLAHALRENLRRRKAQARAADTDATLADGAPPAEPPPRDEADA